LPEKYQVTQTFVLVEPHLMKLMAVYKIPPLKVNEGHRAGDWGDLASPLWKGRLRFIEKGSGAALLFEDGTTGTIIWVFQTQ
jgi:adaptin ear-binding coat-associated protein 1/2